MSRVNDLSPSSSWSTNRTGYRPENPSESPGNEQFEWDHHAAFQNTRRSTPGTEYRPFEERFLLRPSRVTNSIPMEPYSLPTRFIIVNNHLDHGPNRRIPSFLQRFRHMPVSQEQETRYGPPTDINEPNLTRKEQETVLNNLHRQTYKHVPKMARRVSLYYRDLNRDGNVKKNKDEDEKNCAVCLEDFEHGEEVMVTPCKHMFHEECIIPWVKNHSNCPVCRSALCKSVGGENRSAVVPANDSLFSDEIISSLTRAVDEAFVLGA